MKYNFFLVIMLMILSNSIFANDTLTIKFNGTDYEHRWSGNSFESGQHEFLPEGQELSSWKDMISVISVPRFINGDQLANFANNTLSNYQEHGVILRTASIPRTPKTPAEHLIVAVLSDINYLEFVQARFKLIDNTSTMIMYAYRIYGTNREEEMEKWILKHGPDLEIKLMALSDIPSPLKLKNLIVNPSP